MGETSVARAALGSKPDQQVPGKPFKNGFTSILLDIFTGSMQYMSCTTYRMRRRLTMTHLTVLSAIGYTWEALGLIWLAGLAFTKRTLRRQPNGAWLFHLALALLGFSLLGSSFFTGSWLATRFLPQSSTF